MKEDNQSQSPTTESVPGQVIAVKVNFDPPETEVENPAARSSFIPTVEAAGDEPASADDNQAEAVQTEAPSKEPANQPDTKPAEADSKPLKALPAGHKTTSPVLPVVAAVLVAIGLAAVTVYAYMQTQPKKDNKPNTSQSAAPEVKSEDIDKEAKEIDRSLEAADEGDFPISELTDSNLGL